MLQAIGKPSVPLKIMIIGTVIKFAGNVVLIPVMSINGASVSTTVSYGIILILSLAIYLKATKIKLSISEFVPILYATAFCGVSAWIINTQLTNILSDIAIMLISTAVGGLFYISTLLFIKKLK